jgi:antirestriction protein ArdC
MAEPQTVRRDLYAQVTDAIIAALEAETPSWHRPWDPNEAGASGPVNAISGHRHRGINVLLLGMATSKAPHWLSFNQASDKGWQVRHGERASTVFFFKRVDLAEKSHTEADGDPLAVPVLRSYPIFLASQLDGVVDCTPPDISDVPWRTPASAAVMVDRFCVILREGGDRAFYSPSGDFIQVPPRAAFASAPELAATMMHELGQWAGAPVRLDRNLSGRFDSNAYAEEELRAELASASIGNEMSIPAAIERHPSYVGSWLEALRQNKREIFRTSADAQRMADYVLSFHPFYAARQTIEQPAGRETIEAPSSPERVHGAAMPAHIRRSLRRDRQGTAAAAAGTAPEDNPAPAFRPR